jgi:hypothetical protein
VIVGVGVEVMAAVIVGVISGVKVEVSVYVTVEVFALVAVLVNVVVEIGPDIPEGPLGDELFEQASGIKLKMPRNKITEAP